MFDKRNSDLIRLWVSQKSTYVEGIAELQRRAGKSISMSFRGQTPQVSSSKYLPAKVKQGVNALNNVLTNHVGALKRLSKVPKQTVALTKEVRNFLVTNSKMEWIKCLFLH